jgi:RNA polymerase sigma-70 factor (ECF subfamily)
MDVQGFKIQVFPLKNRLFRIAKRLLDDGDEAQDVVQDVFVKLWNRRDKLDEYRSVEALAVVTARNICLDKLKSKRFKTESIENNRIEIEERNVENPYDHSEIVQRIHNIIKTLPEQQQTIIQLRDIEGFDYEEIAGILGMQENAVRVNISRARKKIRDILSENQIV